jgi:glycosyltransferase involved in cell wall biosynthesis
MRILHISSAVHYGGGERHLVDLCRGLHERGHDVYVAIRPTSRWQERLAFLPPDNLLHVSIRNSFGVFSAKRIADFARERQIDIIHAHVARDYIPANIASMVARETKFVLTRHVMFPLKPFNRFALRNLSRAIAVSPAVADGLQTLFSAKKVAVIPNGIHIREFADGDREVLGNEFRSFHQVPPDVPLIGTVGQLTELKGQREYVLAAAEIIKVLPNARFVIVGRDNSPGQPFRRDLKRLVEIMDLSNNVLFLDWVEDLSPLLSALDVYVSASHSESFGLATLEAMAHAVPVVATETEGSRELLQREDLLVQILDPVALATKIVQLLNDKPSAHRIGRELQQRAAANFSLPLMVESTEKLYIELIAGRSKE